MDCTYFYTAPSGSPEHLSGVVVSPTSIQLTWDPPVADQQNGIIRQYLINVTELETGVLMHYSTNQTQTTIESLHPFYTYNFTVTAVTVEKGPYTDVITIQTHQQGWLYGG